jgi:hypothetical protein
MSYTALKKGPDRELTAYERETLDHMPHPSDATFIPIYCLCKLSPAAIADLEKSFAEPDYVEPTGMQFKFVPWKKDNDGNELDMLRIAKRKRKGLLVFLDRESLEQRSVRVSDYSIWDDGWGEEEQAPDGTKGEGLKWGRVMFGEVLRVWMDVEVGVAELDKFVIGGPKAMKLTRWGKLEG